MMSLINVATVDLDEPNEEDLIEVKTRLESFVNVTGSDLGKRIIDNWQTEHAKIIKVNK